jgi:hypothetical protein
MSMTNNVPLVAELEPMIKQFIRLRAYIKLEQEKLKEAMSEYERGKTLLGNYLASTLVQSRLSSVSAPSGTAYTTSKVDYKVVDKGAALRWLLQQNDWEVWELFDLNPSAKDIDAWAARRLEEYIEGVKLGPETPPPVIEDFIPPGLNRTSTVFIKVRKKGDIADDA